MIRMMVIKKLLDAGIQAYHHSIEENKIQESK